MASVTLENLSKYFGNTKAVNNLNLKIKDEEFMVFLGPSGCGKTTALRLVAGLETPTSGKIYFDDEVVNGLEPKERNIAMVFQEYALYPHMSVFDNMALCLKVNKVPKDEIIKKVKETAKILQIENLLGRKPPQLSGGQQQRVALGRAIIRNPSVYLMDEPLSNLDAILRVSMRAELKHLHQKLKTTTIYVTHDQAEAMVMADRVTVLKGGKLLQVDAPDHVYNHPKNKFIAGFIGSPQINLIDCSLFEKKGKILLDAGVFSLELPNQLSNLVRKLAPSSEVILGIRPEHLSIRERGKIKGGVYFFQQLGGVGYLNLKVGDNVITASVAPDFKAKIGEKLPIEIDLSHLALFDKRTEEILI